MFRTFQVNRLSSSSMARRTGRPGSLRLRYRPLEYAFGESNAPSTVRRTSPKLRKRASEAEAKLKRLYDRREELLDDIRAQYMKTGTVTKIMTSRKVAKRASTVGNKVVDRDR